MDLSLEDGSTGINGLIHNYYLDSQISYLRYDNWNSKYDDK